MSEPTVSGSPPPPLALVELLSSLLLPHPAATRETTPTRRTAKNAVSRVLLIKLPPIQGVADPGEDTYLGNHAQGAGFRSAAKIPRYTF